MWLDTLAWVAWLDAATTTRFAYPLFDPAKGYILGVMIVRKERRVREGVYWMAYRRDKGKVRKVYLGGVAALTHAALLRLPEPYEKPTTVGRRSDEHAWRRDGQ